MKARLVLLATWFNEDPRRVRVISLAVAMALALAATVAPEAIAFAGPEATSGGG